MQICGAKAVCQEDATSLWGLDQILRLEINAQQIRKVGPQLSQDKSSSCHRSVEVPEQKAQGRLTRGCLRTKCRRAAKYIEQKCGFSPTSKFVTKWAERQPVHNRDTLSPVWDSFLNMHMAVLITE